MHEEAHYDPFSANPAAAYPALRAAQCPVHRYQGAEHSFYALSRHADVRSALARSAVFTMKYGQMHTYLPGQGLTVDPPVHTVLRRLLNPLFTPQRVSVLASKLEKIAVALVGEMAPRRNADFYADFACSYPVHVAAEVLGVDPSRKDEFRSWVSDFTAGLNSGDQALETSARKAVYGYFGSLMQERRAALARGDACPDDLISVLISGEHPEGRPFEDEELLPNTILLLAGGVDTSSFLLTNCTYRLLENRALWERVCADASLIPLAIEESLRFDSPVFGTFRTNDEPVNLHGVDIPQDSKIQLLYASANRDPAVFPDPDTYRLDRDIVLLRRDHLAFGGGVHACIGNSLARLSAKIALTVLTRRLPSLRLAGTPRRYEKVPAAIAINNGLVSLPIRWEEEA